MSKYSSPSDYTNRAVDYSPSSGASFGYYTNSNLVAQLLQIPDFTATSNPSATEVGTLIKRVEDFIDEKTSTGYREIFYKDEYHNFTSTGISYNLPKYWNDYVGFVQLDRHNIRKIIKLEVWQGSSWMELASSVATVTIDDYTNVSSITLKMPGKTASSGEGIFVLNTGQTTSTFDNLYGNSTMAQEIVSLINERYPSETGGVTSATASKSLKDDNNSGTTHYGNISKFFYASVDSEDGTKVNIASLLGGDDGTNCTIAVSGSGLSKTDFTDKETQKRLGDWWKISREGRIFFRRNFPYLEHNSCRITYTAGSSRVPAVISDAATKLVACEILRHDDQTVLIADTGAAIDIKTKHDLLKEEAMAIINGKKESVFLIE
tara:strand:+ start:71 stop:1201 length:1131 start_codon:yes stop_codon:yes gene_type:complete